MSEAKKPSLKQAQNFLILGVLVGVLAGCLVGAGLTNYFTGRVAYEGGSFPNELTGNYQNHYLAMVVDSYVLNQQIDWAEERLKSFNATQKIRGLANRAAEYGASGRTVEAQQAIDLANQLRERDSWNTEQIQRVVGQLTEQFQNEPNGQLKQQALSEFSAQLTGAVPAPADPTQPGAEPAPTQAGGAAAPAPSGGGFTTMQTLALCLCLLVLILAIVFGVLYYVRKQTAAEMSKKKEVVYEGPGTPPIMQQSFSYTSDRSTFDESISLETDDGGFLGEAGMAIQDVTPDTDPKRPMDFDVWVFDKTDINTYSRIVMTQAANDDDVIQTKVDANQFAEPVLAKQGEKTVIESQTMRIEITLKEVEVDESDTYFTKLTTSMDIFLKEDANIEAGRMAVPDHLG